MFPQFLLSAILIHLVQTINRYAPMWVTSPYIKCDSKNVIAVKTGNASTPTATIPFPGVAFTSVPNIGNGAFIYQGTHIYISGDDGLASEMFEINRTSVN